MSKLESLSCILLAGGRGSRLGKVTANIPKPLVRVGKYSLLEHNLFYLRDFGIKNLIISIGYKGNAIKEYLGKGDKYGMKINYVSDPYPLGDAGAFKFIYKDIGKRVILANADEIRVGLDLEKMLEFHQEKEAIATLALIKKAEAKLNDIAEINNKKRITRFIINASAKETYSNLTYAGLYFMEKEVLECIPKKECLMTGVIGEVVKSKKFYGFVFNGKYFNVGTENILKKARKYFHY
ncbi:MAG: nucleotidyltransferase family protein [Nanoarchaeota archaeon]|nr:nucleotidyltransferase family protein [Nanoarchaeota archaeon]